MITDADIKKLKGVFLTKEDSLAFITKTDAKKFATKDDLKGFATKDDLKKFATKNDLKKFATKDDLKEAIADVRVEIGEVRDLADTTARAIARIENTLDGIAGAINDLRTENGAGAVHLARHDRQISAIAVATRISLPN